MMETKDMIMLLTSGQHLTSAERYEIALHLQTIAERLHRQEAEIEKLAREREWISVEDPPKENGKYLVSAADGLTVYADRYEKRRKGFLTAGAEYWMPLPKPPKPKEPTFKDVFLEKFPKAATINGRPGFCILNIFPYLPECTESIGDKERCKRCWNHPYFEEEGEAE